MGRSIVKPWAKMNLVDDHTPDEQTGQAIADTIRATVVEQAVDRLNAVHDAHTRAEAALAALQAASDLRGALAAVRATAVREMKAELGTWAAVAEALGCSVPRAHQIAEGRRR